ILLGNGDGTFGAPTTIPVGNNPDAIVAGDFNNDGKLDLAVANSTDGTVTLLLGSGDGTFTQATGSPYAVGHGPYQIAAADFNGDGKLDLAVANLTDGTVSILLQQKSARVDQQRKRHLAAPCLVEAFLQSVLPWQLSDNLSHHGIQIVGPQCSSVV